MKTKPTEETSKYQALPDVFFNTDKKELKMFIVYYTMSKTLDFIDTVYFKARNAYFDAKLAIRNTWSLLSNGFKVSDVWDVHFWFCTITPKIIRQLAKQGNGYPIMFSDEMLATLHDLIPDVVTEDLITNDYAITLNDWLNILYKLADLLQNSNSATCTYENNAASDSAYSARQDVIEQKCEANYIVAMKLFTLLLPHLWD